MTIPQLYEFQKEAIRKLHSGCILAGGVGTGKSITSLAYFLQKECKHRTGANATGTTYQPVPNSPDLYIITTARKRDSLEWVGELNKFALSPGSNTGMGGIFVTIDSWNNIGKYRDVQGAFFIFDEQRAVGSGSWAKDFIRIGKANHWIMLSATPGDTWNDYIPVFLANGFYKNRTHFMRRHAVYDRWSKFPRVTKWLDEDYLKRLRDHILVPMEMPRETERKVYQVYVPYDKEKYKRLQKDRWNIFKDEPIENFPQLAINLRRVVNMEPARLKETARLCEGHQRVIIFYNLEVELEQLRKLNKMTGIPVFEWNGKRHDPLPTGDSWIYLVQYNAGAEGWNCITCNTIIFYSLNYSYKVMEQAAGRIDRMNTPYKLLYYYMIRSYAPIDLGILRALKNKENFNAVSFLKKENKTDKLTKSQES